MNKVFPSAILFAFMLTELPAQPQSTIRDAVILKNGTSVVGTLVASSDDSIRIQTGEGNLLVFHKKEVVARTKENVLPTYIPVEDQKVPSLVFAPTLFQHCTLLLQVAPSTPHASAAAPPSV